MAVAWHRFTKAFDIIANGEVDQKENKKTLCHGNNYLGLLGYLDNKKQVDL